MVVSRKRPPHEVDHLALAWPNARAQHQSAPFEAQGAKEYNRVRISRQALAWPDARAKHQSRLMCRG
eukprot:1158483-Pelagomonas_calceolata.AAC.8